MAIYPVKSAYQNWDASKQSSPSEPLSAEERMQRAMEDAQRLEQMQRAMRDAQRLQEMQEQMRQQIDIPELTAIREEFETLENSGASFATLNDLIVQVDDLINTWSEEPDSTVKVGQATIFRNELQERLFEIIKVKITELPAQEMYLEADNARSAIQKHSLTLDQKEELNNIINLRVAEYFVLQYNQAVVTLRSRVYEAWELILNRACDFSPDVTDEDRQERGSQALEVVNSISSDHLVASVINNKRLAQGAMSVVPDELLSRLPEMETTDDINIPSIPEGHNLCEPLTPSFDEVAFYDLGREEITVSFFSDDVAIERYRQQIQRILEIRQEMQVYAIWRGLALSQPDNPDAMSLYYEAIAQEQRAVEEAVSIAQQIPSDVLITSGIIIPRLEDMMWFPQEESDVVAQTRTSDFPITIDHNRMVFLGQIRDLAGLAYGRYIVSIIESTNGSSDDVEEVVERLTFENAPSFEATFHFYFKGPECSCEEYDEENINACREFSCDYDDAGEVERIISSVNLESAEMEEGFLSVDDVLSQIKRVLEEEIMAPGCMANNLGYIRVTLAFDVKEDGIHVAIVN